jgi:hypothetical protein
MLNFKFRKELLTVEQIGFKRFLIGVFSGIITATILSLAFHYFREIFRYQTSLSTDLLILNDIEISFFNLFFSSLSVVMGFNIVIWIWMSNHNHKKLKDRMYKQLSRNNALLIFWLILMLVFRFGSPISNIIWGMHGYDNHIHFLENYYLLFILLPFVVFLQSWLAVKLVYRTSKWFFISLICCILATFLLNLTTTVNEELINQNYHKKYQSDYQMIDLEVKNAFNNYGIKLEDESIETIKKWTTEKSIQQVMKAKEAFSKNQLVSLDTIILQKIIIRLCKEGTAGQFDDEMDRFWRFATPKDVLKQLEMSGFSIQHQKELFEVLKEQILLVNLSQTDWQISNQATETEKRRLITARSLTKHKSIQQLKEVREMIVNDKKYSEFINLLPELKPSI